MLDQDFIVLLGTSPYLVKMEIMKHLDHLDLFKIALASYDWELSISSYLEKDETIYWISLSTEEKYTEITVSKEQYSSLDKLHITFSVNRDCTEKSFGEIRSRRSLMCFSKSSESYEQDIVKVVYNLRTLLPMYFGSISVNFDFGFSLRFLKSLGMEHLDSLILLGDKAHLNGMELEKLLKTMHIRQKLKLEVKTTGEIRGGRHFLGSRELEFRNSNWLTGHMFVKHVDCTKGVFKRCRLKARDFNRYFKLWQNGKKTSWTSLEVHLKNEIILPELLRGLKAKTWDPRVRARRDLHNYSATNVSGWDLIDLANGYDIRNEFGKIGTIHLSENKKVLKFHYWIENFPLIEYRGIASECLEKIENELKRGDLTDEIREDLMRMRICWREEQLCLPKDAMSDN